MANRNWANGGKLFTMHKEVVLLDCSFIVDSANGNGLGIRSLKGPCIENIFMHTSAAPLGGNPNPAAGDILVILQDNYNRYLGGFSGFGSPVSGTPLTSTTAGNAYTIVSLGTTTVAQWVAKGFPIGVVPAVGASFIATATGAIGGTGAVEVPLAAGSGCDHMELIGDPNLTLAPQNPAQGGTLLFRCMLSNAQATPADGTVIGMAFYLLNSAVQVAGG